MTASAEPGRRRASTLALAVAGLLVLLAGCTGGSNQAVENCPAEEGDPGAGGDRLVRLYFANQMAHEACVQIEWNEELVYVREVPATDLRPAYGDGTPFTVDEGTAQIHVEEMSTGLEAERTLNLHGQNHVSVAVDGEQIRIDHEETTPQHVR